MTPAAVAEVLATVLEPHIDEMERILADGDIALVLDAPYLTVGVIERLRGSESGPLVRVSPEHAISVIADDDPDDLRTFLAATGLVARALVVTGRAYICVRFQGRRLSLVRP